MKEMYLTYNPFAHNYVYYETKQGDSLQKNRQEFELDSNLTKKLDFVDKKRKSVLNCLNLPEKEINKLEKFFKNTKVSIKS